MKLKVMTFNLRVDNSGDGINMFGNRFPRIAEMLKSELPDLVGFQEVTEPMAKYLIDNIGGYVFQGCGREKNYNGESMLLGYKKDTFSLIALENHWLSLTPEQSGSTFGGDQSSCPRMFTAVKLYRQETGVFWFVNTHLDHVGKTARFLGSVEIIRFLSEKAGNCKFLLTGDFNATPDTPEVRIYAENGITDCTASLGGTFHDFGRIEPEKREKIDYIFSNAAALDCYVVPDEGVDGIYYSDHFPVVSVVEL